MDARPSYPEPSTRRDDLPEQLQRGTPMRWVTEGNPDYAFADPDAYQVHYHAGYLPNGQVALVEFVIDGEMAAWASFVASDARQLARYLHEQYGSRTYVIRYPGAKVVWDSAADPADAALTGKAIRSFRDSRGWTQAEMARQIGTTVTTISRWENDAKRPTGLYAEAVRRLMDETNEEE